MRDYCRDRSVKKVQDSVVNAMKVNPEFVNAIAQKIGLRPPQLVAQFTQPLNSQETLVLSLRRQPTEPRQEWARSVLLLVKDDLRSGHSSFSLFANLRNRKW